MTNQDELTAIRASVAALCAQFPGEYWRELDRTRTYPTAFVEAMTREGFLGALIPEAFGVTEPTSGSETLALSTSAVRDGDDYVVNGQKIWTSRAEHSDFMILLARTTPRDQIKTRMEGLSVFMLDMNAARAAGGLTIRPIRTMMNHATTEVFFDNVRVPASNLIG